MKEIKLTRGMVTLVDDEDYEYLSQWKWSATNPNDPPYATRHGRKKTQEPRSVLMHRVIMNTPDDLEVDHIDHNGLNNQKTNLRICSGFENRLNRQPNRNHKYVGVGVYKNIFRARIRVNNIIYYLGYFKTQEEAALSYNRAALMLKGEFAYLNLVVAGK